MAVVFARRLAVPMWAIAFLMMALTLPAPTLMPRTTLFVMTVVGIGLIVLTLPRVIPRWRTSRSLVRVVTSREESDRRADALDLVRMDDDGGWQMARPGSRP